MSAREFEADAEHWQHLAALDRNDAIATACRGSGNPATLAWIAEALELGPDTTVVDIGAGLGGPAAWLNAHYHCPVIAVDPVRNASRCARHIFDLPALVATGSRLPLPDNAAACALLLGVLSVVADPIAVLVEARRTTERLAVLAYLSTTDATVRRGGSTFVPLPVLITHLEQAGWRSHTEPTPAVMEPPPTWDGSDDQIGQPDPDEKAVDHAIASGAIQPHVVVASAGLNPVRPGW